MDGKIHKCNYDFQKVWFQQIHAKWKIYLVKIIETEAKTCIIFRVLGKLQNINVLKWLGEWAQSYFPANWN
jgi:hypothetical protein